MYDYDYAAIQNDAEETAPPNPRKTRWLIIVSIAGSALLVVGLIWFIFVGIKIIFPDYIAGNTMIQAGGKYIYIQNGTIRCKGGVEDDPKDIISAENAEGSLLSNGRTVYYVEDGDICSVELDGKDAKTIRKSDQKVVLVHRYHDLLYYISSKENTDTFCLYQYDLKKDAETQIDGFKTAVEDFYVYGDKLYYYNASADDSKNIWRYDFKTEETKEFLANATICVGIGYGEEPMFCGCQKADSDLQPAYYDTALYKIKGDEAEKLADLPKKVNVACAPQGSDDILLTSVELKDTGVSVTTLLFNVKTGETKQLKTDVNQTPLVLQDWKHRDRVYLCYSTASNEIKNVDYVLGDVFLLKDGELKECTVNGSVAFDGVSAAVIDEFFIDGDFNGHRITVKEDVR